MRSLVDSTFLASLPQWVGHSQRLGYGQVRLPDGEKGHQFESNSIKTQTRYSQENWSVSTRLNLQQNNAVPKELNIFLLLPCLQNIFKMCIIYCSAVLAEWMECYHRNSVAFCTCSWCMFFAIIVLHESMAGHWVLQSSGHGRWKQWWRRSPNTSCSKKILLLLVRQTLFTLSSGKLHCIICTHSQ